MELKIIDKEFAICKVEDFSQINLNDEFIFVGKTDNELSVVCEMESIANNCTHIDRGWIGFRIQGELDFSLIGIISKLSAILAENKIGIFTVSTYDTDYILVKKEKIEEAKEALRKFDEACGNTSDKKSSSEKSEKKKKSFMEKIKETFEE